MEKLLVIRTIEDLQQLRDYISQNDYIAFDTETTGVDQESIIIGFSVSAHTHTGYYVILHKWDAEKQVLSSLETTSAAHEILSMLVGKNLIMHNGVFDCNMVRTQYKIDLMPSLHTDTMILSHLLNENRHNGLKELGVSIFGEGSKEEQNIMKASVKANGGMLTKEKYELYKADAELIGRYGAKDTILTMKLFYHLVDDLYAQGLEDFFYVDESMPLLRGPTYDLNTTGLKVDPDRLQKLKAELEADCMHLRAFIYKEIDPLVKEKYPATKKTNTFNIGASKQLAWLLFVKIDLEFSTLTESGRELCHKIGMRLPYSPKAKREFIQYITRAKGHIYEQPVLNVKTGKMGRPKKIGDVWNYLAADKATLNKFSKRYAWVESLLKYSKNLKLLNTYVEGLQQKMKYGIIRPSFLQHGTTSGRYSSRHPNFQNLPRDDKRVKSCIISRSKKVFVGADYSQLEPRVFASFSGDTRLLACFKDGDDFYSVIGATVFDKIGYSLKKDAPNSFAKTFPDLRNVAKTIALSATYGTTAPKMAPTLNRSMQEAQNIIDDYFEKFPSVKNLMLQSHEIAKKDGAVTNLFGRRRRIPQAAKIPLLFKNTPHEKLDYEWRNLLNLSINHRIQSTGASIMNRAAIAFWQTCKDLGQTDPRWLDVKIVMQVHDELIVEGPEELGEDIAIVLKDSMENTVTLPGVDLVADPKIAKDIAELK